MNSNDTRDIILQIVGGYFLAESKKKTLRDYKHSPQVLLFCQPLPFCKKPSRPLSPWSAQRNTCVHNVAGHYMLVLQQPWTNSVHCLVEVNFWVKAPADHKPLLRNYNFIQWRWPGKQVGLGMCTGAKTNNTNHLQAIHRYVNVQRLNTATLIDCGINSALILFTQLPALDSVNCINVVHTAVVARYNDITKNDSWIKLI